MVGMAEIAEGTLILIGHEAGEHAGRIACLSVFWDGDMGRGSLGVTLADGASLFLPPSCVSTAWEPHVSRILAEAEVALTRAKRLLALLTIRDVVKAGGDVLTASGLDPWCINEGRATGDEPLRLWQIEGAIERARAVIDALDAGEQSADLVEALRAVAGVVGDTACIVRIPTVGAVFDAGDETIDAAGIDVWCMRDGRARRDEPVGSNASWRLECASRDLGQLATDLEAALGHARAPAFPPR